MVLLLEAPSVRYIPMRLLTIVSMQPLMMRNTEHVDNRRLSSRIYIAPTPVLFRNLAPCVSLASLRAARPPTAGSHCLTMPGKETPAHYFHHHVADRHATWRTPRNRTNGEGNNGNSKSGTLRSPCREGCRQLELITPPPGSPLAWKRRRILSANPNVTDKVCPANIREGALAPPSTTSRPTWFAFLYVYLGVFAPRVGGHE